jgi:4-hydroxybenzoate polyprenyltransferase
VAREYARLLRVSHYIKNLLIFIPLIFSLSFNEISNIFLCIVGFIVFSLLSSAVYIINDLKDIEKDRSHSIKSKRPLAAGTISRKNAVKLLFILLAMAAAIAIYISLLINNFYASGVLILYLAVNVVYSFGAKNIPIIDIIILASGYILRVAFGGILIGTGISFWLYLVITFCAFYLGFGKRRNELIKAEKNTRNVLKNYSYNFLDKNMYVCQTLCTVFYALWSIDSATIQRLHTQYFVFTVPIIFLILLKYSLNIERDCDEDPTAILLKDKGLCALVSLYITSSIIILYVWGGGGGKMDVYDFDHTIYRGDSSFDFFTFVLRKKPYLEALLPLQLWGIMLHLFHLITKETMKSYFFMFVRFISVEAMIVQFWEKYIGKPDFANEPPRPKGANLRRGIKPDFANKTWGDIN